MEEQWNFPYSQARHNLRGIIVTCPDGNELEFDSIMTASKELNLPYQRMRLALKHEQELCGYKFRDKDDY